MTGRYNQGALFGFGRLLIRSAGAEREQKIFFQKENGGSRNASEARQYPIQSPRPDEADKFREEVCLFLFVPQ
jgi:hypothetical protein